MAERVQLSVEDYLAELLALVEPITDTDLVPLDEATGRVLAEPITSPLPVPHFANSAMDGFAVRHDEVSVGQPLTEVGDVPAGSAADPALGAGECIRIMTGAPLPTAADTVVPRELVTDTGQGVVVHDQNCPAHLSRSPRQPKNQFKIEAHSLIRRIVHA